MNEVKVYQLCRYFDGHTPVEFETLGDAQQALFTSTPRLNDDAEIVVRDKATGHALGSYLYRMGKECWFVTRTLRLAP